jgi:hypothetical protein
MQSSRARREQGCERYLLLEHGVFANTLQTRAPGRWMVQPSRSLHMAFANRELNNFLLRPSCCRLEVSACRY